MKGISKELQAKIPVLKPGEKAIFEIEGIRYDAKLKRHIIRNSTSIPTTDRIFDPWGGKEGKGEYVDISYVKSETPAGPNSLRDTVVELGNITFTRDKVGRITIKGGNKRDEALYEYLFLTNLNASNAGKDWFIKPNVQAKFHQVKQNETSKDFLKGKRLIRQAQDAIDVMPSTKLREIAKGLMLNTDEHTHVDTIRELLYKKAEVNPESVLKLDDDISITYIAQIKDAEKAGIIVKDLTNSVWRWSDGEDVICTILPGKTPEQSLKDFFISDKGQAVYGVIDGQLNPKSRTSEPKEKVKTRPANRK